MAQRSKDMRRYSRRDILKGVPLAVLGGAVLGVALGSPVVSRIFRRRQAPTFPEGSIFTPADDQRPRT